MYVNAIPVGELDDYKHRIFSVLVHASILLATPFILTSNHD